MALVLRLEKRKMGKEAKSIFEMAEEGDTTIFVPAIVLAEVMYLSEKGRIECSLKAFEEYARGFPKIRAASLNAKTLSAASSITDIPELHDRLIAATARQLKCPLLTNDPIIQASKFVSCLW